MNSKTNKILIFLMEDMDLNENNPLNIISKGYIHTNEISEILINNKKKQWNDPDGWIINRWIGNIRFQVLEQKKTKNV